MYLHRFFKLNKGKELSPLEKPLLKKEKRLKRLEWAIEMKKMLENKNFYMVHLDEKWFYTTSRRKKIKYLRLHATKKPAKISICFKKEPTAGFY